MRIGFFAPHVGPGSSRDAIARACDIADELGADTLWSVDHIAFPYGFRAVYPYATHEFGESPDKPLEWWDCLSVLTFLAARTERVKLGTGVLVLPYRHPVATAKAIATIDVLSGGRVLFGIGVGWLLDEFAALELKPFDDRGAVTDEQLQIFKALWTQERPSFDGRFYRFPEISVTPLPAQRPHPPILVGGNSQPALRRTVAVRRRLARARCCCPTEMAEHKARLQAMAADAGRTDEIPVSILVATHLTKDASVYRRPRRRPPPPVDDRHRRAGRGPAGGLPRRRRRGDPHPREHRRRLRARRSGVDGMELFLREVWPAFLAR